ncbi:MAG TPA: DinB family protein, partial [Planctomycetes bacterium]|nr:DinB family protein [Planctomycetota bacterium]
GRQPGDTDLMTSRFRKQFSKGSQPDPVVENNPSLEEIREVFARVHQQALLELENYPLEQLDDPVDQPYAAYATKYGALLFCAHHEMLHAGQIGLLRRLLGKSPIR